MISDLTGEDRASPARYDICIIGSGPAGTAVARELAGAGYEICVLESGSTSGTDATSALCEVSDGGIDIAPDSLQRGVGGASTVWAGLSAPLDPIDFEPRSWVDDAGWPLERDDLVPYYRRASADYEFPSWDWFTDPFESLDHPVADTPEWRVIVEKPFIRPVSPLDFGASLVELCRDNPNIDLYLATTVTRLDGDDQTAEVHRAVARDGVHNQIEFEADAFVLACGGIGNPRLLLHSTFAESDGLGNDEDQVGRYLMNHPRANYGYVTLDEPVPTLPYVNGSLAFGDDYVGYLGLKPGEEAQRDDELLNSYVRLRPVPPWSVVYGSAEVTATQLRRTVTNGSVLKGQLRRSLAYLSRSVRTETDRFATFVVRNFMEMEPTPENRVTLANETDEYGLPVARVHHRPTALDRRSMVAVHDTLETELEASGWGDLLLKLRLQSNRWPVTVDAAHYMGTTRMGADESSSVVDRTCRLHASPNVYIAGSSVFPTAGTANPTYTIVALAIRLAEHLGREY